MNRRATDPTADSRAPAETEAPLVPDLGTRAGSTDTTIDTAAATRRDRAERRRRDPFEIALMEDSE